MCRYGQMNKIEKVISKRTYGRISKFNESCRKSRLQEPLYAAVRQAVSSSEAWFYEIVKAID
jgi:hypothetical protein